VKLGDVLKKEREKSKLSVETVAKELGVPESEYLAIEAGETAAEQWGPLLASIAIELETPSTRLLSESGRSQDTSPGQAGSFIARHRERRNKSTEEMARALDLEEGDYVRIEKGETELERYGPLLLRFSELIDQPLFNLFYPCGVSFQKLNDYP
jgi:transcriptional regulator with XRE-family HTH domain